MRAFISLALTAGVLVSVPTATGLPEAAAASSSAAGVVHHQRYSTRDRMVTVHDGPDGTHETTIDTRLYRPKAATRKHPRPSILMTHGFGLTKDSAEVVNTARFLARHGYEPVLGERGEIALVNCPFHRLAEEHRSLVCGMNLDFLAGLLEGIGPADRLDARLAPEPGYCCVRVRAA